MYAFHLSFGSFAPLFPFISLKFLQKSVSQRLAVGAVACEEHADVVLHGPADERVDSRLGPHAREGWRLKEVAQRGLDDDRRVLERGQPLHLALEPRAAAAEGAVGVCLGLALDRDAVLEADYRVVSGSEGLQFGQRFDVLDNLPLFEAGAATPAATTWSEYDEPMIETPGSWQTDARLCLLAQAPNPCTVGGVVIAITTKERG